MQDRFTITENTETGIRFRNDKGDVFGSLDRISGDLRIETPTVPGLIFTATYKPAKPLF